MRACHLSVVLALVLALQCALAAEGPLAETPESTRLRRVSTRQENNLNMELSHRASLLFRIMDHDHDNHISEEDARQSQTQLQQHMPHVSVDEFLSFMEVADKDGDKMLNLEEFLKGLADGLQEAKQSSLATPPKATSPTAVSKSAQVSNLLETGATTSDRVSAASTEARRVDEAERMRFELQRSVSSEEDEVEGGDDDCVMCQYIIERCEANIKQSGVLPGFSSVAAFDSYLELEQQVTPHDAQDSDSLSSSTDDDGDVSLLEVQSTAAAKHKQLYFDQTAAGIIGSTRQATRVQRQLERQKYNEVYRVVDLTLDDVCEQGMPIKFYGICKKIYKLQSDVVDGLRYQYRAADVCFRIALCPKGSYITTGVHSRYKGV